MTLSLDRFLVFYILRNLILLVSREITQPTHFLLMTGEKKTTKKKQTLHHTASTYKSTHDQNKNKVNTVHLITNTTRITKPLQYLY